MTESDTDGSKSPNPMPNGSGPVNGASANGTSPAGATSGVNGSSPARGDEASPEEIGADLMHRLDTLDDRLQRSQEKMIALLDRKLGDAGGPASARTGGAVTDPAQARWTPPPTAPSPFEAPKDAAPEDPMETWFNVAPPKTGTSFLTAPDAAPEAPAGRSGAAAVSDVTASAAPTASVPPVSAPLLTPPEAVGPEAGLPKAPGADIQTPPLAEMADIIPSQRPAWQSNLITAAVAAVVIVVALFLVGLF